MTGGLAVMQSGLEIDDLDQGLDVRAGYVAPL